MVFAGCALGLLTRVSALPVVLICAAGLVLAAALPLDGERPVRWSWPGALRGLGWAAGVVAACAATSGWFYLRNVRLYGDPLASEAVGTLFGHVEVTGHESLLTAMFDYNSYLTSLSDAPLWFGRTTYWNALDLKLSVALIVLVLVGAAAYLFQRLRAGRVAPRPLALVALCLMLFLGVVASGLSHSASGGNLHPRYFLPALAVMMAAEAVVLLALPWGERAAFVVLAAAVQAWVTLGYAGQGARSGWRREAAPDFRIARLAFGLQHNGIPGSWAVLGAQLIVASAAFALVVAALWRASQPLVQALPPAPPDITLPAEAPSPVGTPAER
jgi:hypothetical protein